MFVRPHQTHPDNPHLSYAVYIGGHASCWCQCSVNREYPFLFVYFPQVLFPHEPILTFSHLRHCCLPFSETYLCLTYGNGSDVWGASLTRYSSVLVPSYWPCNTCPTLSFPSVSLFCPFDRFNCHLGHNSRCCPGPTLASGN